MEEEPSLKEVLNAVNFCKVTMLEMSDHLKGIREEIHFLPHDAHKIRERTTALEGRISLIEDDLIH